ncbi:MAG: hypothetical protein GQ581_00435, partial [Methyloprofundus sp.]|nr:hypothetical protein [Methyloprofundus sp.]
MYNTDILEISLNITIIAQLRELSDGKPVGFKLSIGRKSEFVAICKAMV